MSLSQLGNASNEAREQRIMKLRQAFKNKEVITVDSACKKFGYKRATVIKWAQDGNIPLIDGNKTVVPISGKNFPDWWFSIWQTK